MLIAIKAALLEVVDEPLCRESEGVPQIVFLSPKSGGHRGLMASHGIKY